MLSEAAFQRPGSPGLLCGGWGGSGRCSPAGRQREPRALGASPLRAPGKEVAFEDVRSV